MKKYNIAERIALVLIIAGGINWGFVGTFNLNLVETIFGVNVLTRIIYVLVGIASIYMILTSMKPAKTEES